MKCSYCGYENQPTNKFCENCGAELVSEYLREEMNAADIGNYALNVSNLEKETGTDSGDKEAVPVTAPDIVSENREENEYWQPADMYASPQYEPYQGMGMPPIPPKKKNSKLGIAVLILGFLGLGSRVLGLIAICLGVYDFVKNKDKKHVLVIIGMVLAILGILAGGGNRSKSGHLNEKQSGTVTEAASKPETVVENTPTMQPSATPTPTLEPTVVVESKSESIAEVPAPETENQAGDADETSRYGSYEEIYNAYAQMIRDATPGLIEEYEAEAAVNDRGIEGLAEISNEKVSKLAEITTEGTSEMASFMLFHGSGSYGEYEDWAGRLYDVYEEEAQKIMDIYMESGTSAMYDDLDLGDLGIDYGDLNLDF